MINIFVELQTRYRSDRFNGLSRYTVIPGIGFAKSPSDEERELQRMHVADNARVREMRRVLEAVLDFDYGF